MESHRMVTRCPVCKEGMAVTELTCERCGVAVRGRFEIPRLCRLPQDLYEFLVVFVKNRGVIREVERELGMSYPTVRARLDATIAALGFDDVVPDADRERAIEMRERVIEMLERGDISPEEAEQRLRGEPEE
jgi:hypothetical protein